jgi:hypothetical protein
MRNNPLIRHPQALRRVIKLDLTQRTSSEEGSGSEYEQEGEANDDDDEDEPDDGKNEGDEASSDDDSVPSHFYPSALAEGIETHKAILQQWK